MEKIFYQTSDLNIATTLLTSGCDIHGINTMDPNRIVFYFDVDKFPDIKNLVENYWAGNLRVDPKEFVSYRRELLTRIHESKRQMEV